MSNDSDPLHPPWWHVRFWFYYHRARWEHRRATEQVCIHGCCVRWLDRRGREFGGFNPVGVDHFEDVA